MLDVPFLLIFLTIMFFYSVPLTLITGIFGMNFEVMPGIHSAAGFWWTMAAMGMIAVALFGIFRARRYIEETGLRRTLDRSRRRRRRH